MPTQSKNQPPAEAGTGSIPNHPDLFVDRHIGPREEEISLMLREIGDIPTLDEMMNRAVPRSIRQEFPFSFDPPMSEREAMNDLAALAAKNRVFRSYLGIGYHDCVTPPAIRRNVLENPGWYTHYTPYQAEISQGRLEALLNFRR